MFHSCKNNKRINKPHEECLRMIYNDKLSSFDEHLGKDGRASTNHRNLQVYEIEMFKFRKGMSTPIMSDLFKIKKDPCYSLKKTVMFIIHQ